MRWFTRSSASTAPAPAPAPTASPAPLSRRRDVVVHVGMGKTGTSSIQVFLRENRDRLAELDVLYPRSPGRGRHHRLGLLVKSDRDLVRSPEWPWEKHDDPGRFRRTFRRRLLSEIEGSELSRVLLSEEILFGRSEPELRRLHRLLDLVAADLRIVVYLRRQDDHLVSRYQQEVKIGCTTRLRDWTPADASVLYDYHARLRTHERLLGPQEMVVRRFEPDAFVGGSLFEDFLAATGIGAPPGALPEVASRNVSLDAESVELLRLLNIHRVENEGAVPGQVDNRELVLRLWEVAAGPVLTLPAPVLDQFMERWRESNRRVAVDYLHDPQGELFRRDRRTRHTTTDQRLDPARLDHFLELLELPEPWHQPLRRIAEREARRS